MVIIKKVRHDPVCGLLQVEQMGLDRQMSRNTWSEEQTGTCG